MQTWFNQDKLCKAEFSLAEAKISIRMLEGVEQNQESANTDQFDDLGKDFWMSTQSRNLNRIADKLKIRIRPVPIKNSKPKDSFTSERQIKKSRVVINYKAQATLNSLKLKNDKLITEEQQTLENLSQDITESIKIKEIAKYYHGPYVFPDFSNGQIKPDQTDQLILDDVSENNLTINRDMKSPLKPLKGLEQDSSSKHSKSIVNRSIQLTQYRYKIQDLEAYVIQLKLQMGNDYESKRASLISAELGRMLISIQPEKSSQNFTTFIRNNYLDNIQQVDGSKSDN